MLNKNQFKSRVTGKLLKLILLGLLFVWIGVSATALHAVQIGNDEVNFITVEYDTPAPGQSTWYYEVISGSGPAISHVTFELGACVTILDAGTWDGPNNTSNRTSGGGDPDPGNFPASPKTDPTTVITGLKFDEEFDGGETRYYYFTVDGNYEVADTNVATKGGPGQAFDTGTVSGVSPTCERLKDYGDLPAPYSTLKTNNGPSHVISGSTILGNCVDAELNGQPSTNADGDDFNQAGPPLHVIGTGACNIDEDGVSVGPGSGSNGQWQNGPNGGSVFVTGSAGACLNAWIDFNGDENLTGAGEQVATNITTTGGSQQIFFNIPDGTFSGDASDPNVVLYARFRLTANCSDYSGGVAAPTGPASSGEVEDYRFVFRPTAVSLQSVVAQTTSGDGLWILVSLALLVGMGTFALLRRRQAHA